MLTLEEIEAEMSQTAISAPPTSTQSGPRVLTLAEIEAQMMANEPEPAPVAPPPQLSVPAPPREPSPSQFGAPSGYANPQELLDSMFPELGKAPPQGKTVPFLPVGAQPPPPGPTPEQKAHMEALHQRITAKIESMSKYNNLMGSSDKDFITRIQLSQLATADPYSSDFYAQVHSALMKSRMAAAGPSPEGPGLVQVAPGLGVGTGVGGPQGNRFGKMGNSTMQKLSTQVKKLVENRAQRNMTNSECIHSYSSIGRD